jgi:enoyl-CoA hydratase/carnithine racemase
MGTALYDMPDEIDVRAEGPIRVITLDRPDSLNAVNDALHKGLARLWPQISADPDARVAVLTGAGRAFSAGGDFAYLQEMIDDPALRASSMADGRELVLGMVRCRVPVIAAVNGPAVGLGCSLVALSDVVYINEGTYLADPHVQVGLVAADGGPLTWTMHIPLLVAKELALTGARIPAARAVELGLANHAVADPLAEAMQFAERMLDLPRYAVEATKRMFNIQLERTVLASIDFALTAEEHCFETADFRATIAGLTAPRKR